MVTRDPEQADFLKIVIRSVSSTQRFQSTYILRVTPSAAGLFWLVWVAIWGVRCFLFDILGNHFEPSGSFWETILGLRLHAAGPWEQQDELKAIVYRVHSISA